MATQKDLDVLKQKLRDLDAKLKSMGGGSAKRDPRFDSAMANQNFKNSMTEQRARMEADKANRRMTPMPPRGDFTQGRLMGAPTNRPIPRGGGLGGLTADQAGIPEDQRKILDDLMARQAQQPIPPGGGMGGSIGAPENMRSPNMPEDIMQAYNNFLQQGMQNRNALNQGAMTDFANMEPGMQATQPATATTPKPAMPVAGMGMQQPRKTPARRNFSTVNTPSARFG